VGDGRVLRRTLLLTVCVLLALIISPGVSADTPPDFPILLSSESLSRYDRLEITCAGIDSTGYTNPFDPAEVSVEGHFIDPDSVEEVVYGFWYQDYQRTQSGSSEVLTSVGSEHWRVRYKKKKVGSYTCYVTVTDSERHGSVRDEELYGDCVGQPRICGRLGRR